MYTITKLQHGKPFVRDFHTRLFCIRNLTPQDAPRENQWATRWLLNDFLFHGMFNLKC